MRPLYLSLTVPIGAPPPAPMVTVAPHDNGSITLSASLDLDTVNGDDRAFVLELLNQCYQHLENLPITAQTVVDP